LHPGTPVTDCCGIERYGRRRIRGLANEERQQHGASLVTASAEAANRSRRERLPVVLILTKDDDKIQKKPLPPLHSGFAGTLMGMGIFDGDTAAVEFARCMILVPPAENIRRRMLP
jgi:hypothetical protein